MNIKIAETTTEIALFCKTCVILTSTKPSTPHILTIVRTNREDRKMLSKNNFKERLRKMEPRKERFSIRKFSVGAASVLIGFFFMGMDQGQTVRAADTT